ncbi:MAG: caspase family protein [bacterium]|nr:caspase family protein [bacterium]
MRQEVKNWSILLIIKFSLSSVLLFGQSLDQFKFQPQTGYSNINNIMDLSKSGRWMVTAEGSEIQIWDVSSGILLRSTQIIQQQIVDLQFSNVSDEVVYCATTDGNLFKINIIKNSVLKDFDLSIIGTRSIRIYKEDKLIIISNSITEYNPFRRNGGVTLFNPNNLSSNYFDVNDGVKLSLISPDSTFLVAGLDVKSTAGTLQVFNLKTGEKFRLNQLQGVMDMSVSKHGFFVVGTHEGYVRQWNPGSKFLMREFKISDQSVTGVHMEDRYQTIYCIADGGIIRRYNRNGQLLKEFDIGTSRIQCFAFDERNAKLTASTNESTFVIELTRNNNIQEFGKPYDWVTSLKFDSNNRLFSVNGNISQSNFEIWNLGRSRLEKNLNSVKDFYVHHDIYPDSSLMAFGGAKGPIIILNYETNQQLYSFSSDKRISCIDIGSNKTIWIEKNKTPRAFWANKYEEHDSINIFDHINNKFIRKLDAGWVDAATISDDQKIAVVASWTDPINGPNSPKNQATKLTIWDLENGIKKGDLHETKYEIKSLDISPDKKIIITGGGDFNNDELIVWYTDEIRFEHLEGHNSQVITTTFSDDGSIFATGEIGRKVIVWDSKTLNKILTIDNLSGYPRTLSISPDNKILVVGSNNGIIKLIRFDNNYEVNLYGNSEDQWVIWDENNYFESSNDATDIAIMSNKDGYYNIEQFSSRLNAPHLILKKLGIGDSSYTNFVERLYKKRNQTSEPLLSSNIPSVVVTEEVLEGPQAHMFFTLKDTTSNIQSYAIYQNGIQIHSMDLDGPYYELSYSVSMIPGTNIIEIEATNKEGYKSIRTLNKFKYDDNQKTNLYYIGIGVSEYEDDSIKNLSYSTKDICDLSHVFSSYAENFQNIETHTFFNKEITKENFSELKNLLTDSRKTDLFILAMSGHGTHVTNEATDFHFLTSDTRLNGNISQQAISMDEIQGLLSSVKPIRKLLLLDACSSGQLDSTYLTNVLELTNDGKGARSITPIKSTKSNSINVTRKDSYIFNDIYRRSGAVVYSSSMGGQLSWEYPEIENGVFTEGIINCLTNRNIDTDENGSISDDELRKCVNQFVVSRTKNLQHPTVDYDNINSDIFFPLTTWEPNDDLNCEQN